MTTPAQYRGMTNLAAEFAAITETDFLLRDNAKWELLQAADQKASLGTSGLVGRYYQEPVADGHAFYEICWVQNGLAYLRHVEIGDAYRAITLERLAKAHKDPLNDDDVLYAVAADFVADNVKRRDAIAALFAKRSA